MSDHLSRRELLLHVDGELPPRRAQQARKHLQSCWNCRRQLELLEGDIGAIVDAQNRAFLPSMPRPSRPWQGFGELVAHLPEPGSRLRRWFRGPKVAMQWAMAGLVLSAAVAAIWLAPPRVAEPTKPNIAPSRAAKAPTAPVNAAPSETRPAAPEAKPISHAVPAVVPTPPAPELDELELGVQYTLHQIGADLSEPIEVRKDAAGIVIAASGASVERKEQLAELFGRKAGVRLELAAPAAANGTPVTVASAARRSEPDQQLAAFFGSAEAQERFTRTVLAADGAVLSRLYALRSLAQRWPAGAEEHLADPARRKLHAMVEDHGQTLRAAVPELRQTLAPFLDHFCADSTTPAAGAPTPWRDIAMQSLAAARKLDADVRAVLTTSAASVVVGRACPEIKAALAQITIPQP